MYADEARAAVLSYFKAPPDYTVIFTANASAALKLVGESYPFTGGSSLVLGVDSHNSVSRYLRLSYLRQLISLKRFTVYENTQTLVEPRLRTFHLLHMAGLIARWLR